MQLLRALLPALATLIFLGARAQIPAAPGNVAISEINYHAYDRTAQEALNGGSNNDDDYDFLEIQNLTSQAVSLVGCSITGGVTLTHFGTAVIPAHGRVVVVADLASFRRRYGGPAPTFTLPPTITVVGEYSQNLSNSGEQLVFKNASNQVIHDFVYSDSGDWPARADGQGATLEVKDPAGDYSDGGNWRGSREYGGTPGTAGTGPRSTVVINEILAHSDTPYTDFIELHNVTNVAVNISGWVITDRATGGNLARFTIPAATTLAPGGFKVYSTADFAAQNPSNPMAFSEFGEAIYLFSMNGAIPAAFEDYVNYNATDVNTSLGRYVNSVGETDFTLLQNITIGQANGAPLVGPLVVSEIMYNPASNEMEYVELYNMSNQVVALWDAAAPPTSSNRFWHFSSAMSFAFPLGASVQPGEYVLVTQDAPSLFRSRYNVPAHVQIFGPYTGALSNGGETVRLRRPGSYDAELANNPTVVVDRVTYDDIAPWPPQADGLGFSLERVNLQAYGNDPANWTVHNGYGSPGGPSQIDSDGDGVADNWEYAYFQTLAHQNFTTADRDGDGQTDYAEYQAGTSPVVSNLPLRLELLPSGAQFLLRHPSVVSDLQPGYYGRSRSYRVLGTPSLVPTDWQPVSGLESVPATGAPLEHSLTPAALHQLYRVEILLP
jgi:hypothetical protein